ncbi:MAG: PhzF family phenazine biosynthesis protein [Acidimicrobiales bacterium]
MQPYTWLWPPHLGSGSTLRGELPFAGHPTLGTCHAWLGAGGISKDDVFIQECGLGLIPLRRDQGLSFATPPLVRSGPVDSAFEDDVAAVLGTSPTAVVEAEWVHNGTGWVGILLEDSESVLTLEPNIGRYSGIEQLDIGVIVPHPENSEVDFEVGGFFSGDTGQLVEDPVTGSLNGPLAQWLIGIGGAPKSYIAADGSAIGRAGRIHITLDESNVWVGGSTLALVSGEID